MQNIGAFFAKYSHIAPPEKIIKEALIEVIQEILHTSLSGDDVTIQNGKVFLNVSSSFKNELYFNKKKCIELVNQKLGGKERIKVLM